MLIDDFYQIIDFDSTNDQINARIALKKDHEIYKGHFPDQPVVPGVIQLQIIKELLEKSLNHKLMLTDITTAKYLRMIDPNVSPELFVEIKLKKIESKTFKVDARIFEDTTVFTKLKATLS